jgi:hypothetical protein
MKKGLLFLLAFAITTTICTAQKTSGFAQGDKLLNLGIGVNSYYGGGIPLGASFEIGVSDNISVGANIDYLSSKYDYGFGSSDRFTAMYFGGRASYHLNELLSIGSEKVDLYVGATIGYRRFSFTDTYSGGVLTDSYGSGIYLGIFAGGKYYFSEKLGAFAELGAIGSTNVRLGVAFKF